MAKRCDHCGRGRQSSVSRSHSNIATKRVLNINLQSKKIDGERLRICTRCLKTSVKNASVK